MIEQFLTIFKQFGPFEIKEKGSRFISHCFPVKTSEEAEETVKKLWKEHYNATHICYAYNLGEGQIEKFRYNDDGEPSGTAGLPIYNEIIRKELFNVLVTSIRYYGGTKLGTGGLARTYGLSAKTVLEEVEVATIHLKKQIVMEVPFDLTGIAMNHINQFEMVDIGETLYSETGQTMNLKVPVASVEKFIADMIERSNGKVVPKEN